MQRYTAQHPYEPVVKELPTVDTGKTPRNIILMIGDGMGLSHVSAAWVANRGQLDLDACP